MFFSVIVWLLLVPTVTPPNARLVGLALSTEPETAVPESANAAGDPGALLTMLRLPLALPLDVGANCTLNAVLWFAATVNGRESAPRLKPVPVTLVAVTVKGAFPVFDKFTLCWLLPPVDTLPKLMLLGLRDMVGAAPVPLKDTTIGELDTLLVIDAVAVRLPATCGAN